MKYISTRGNNQNMTSAQAIIAGLAKDGGLFVPESIPQVDMEFIQSLSDLSYQQRAVKVLSCFLTDYTQEEITGCVAAAATSAFVRCLEENRGEESGFDFGCYLW